MNYLSSRTKKIILISLLSVATTAIILLVFFSIDFSKAATEGRNISGRAQIVNTGNFIHFNSEAYGADVQIGSPNGSGDRYLTGNAYSEDSGLISFSSMSSSISPDFNGYYPKFDREVNVIKEQTDGKILVGGHFYNYNNSVVKRMARLNADGTLDATFNVGEVFSNTEGIGVVDLAVQSDGKIVAAFDSAILIDGQYSYYIGRFNADGSVDNTFNSDAGFNNAVNSIDIQPDGKIIAGGKFGTYKGSTQNRLIRLDANGNKDASFNMTYVFTGDIRVVKVLSSGKILVGGDFSGYIKRFNSDGSLDSTFTGFSNASIHEIVELDDGSLLIAGDLTNKIRKLSADGAIDSSFNVGTGFNSTVYSIEILSDGSFLVGGKFVSYNGNNANRIAHLNTDGSFDSNYQGGALFDSNVYATLVSGSYTYVGGSFSMTSSVNGYFTRLTATGSVDSNFYQNIVGFDNSVYDAVDYNGRILVGGLFTSYNGETTNKVAILNSDGTKYQSFDAGDSASGSIYAVGKQSDGKVLAAGAFSTFQGNSSACIARMNTDGSYDSSFNVGTGAGGGNISVLKVQGDGKILVGGAFTSINGTTMNRIARLNSDGSIDGTFNIGTGFNNTVNDIEILDSGDIVVVGIFTTYQGVAKNNIVRLNSDGSIDTGFLVTTGFTGASLMMRTVVELSDGDLLVGGNFDSFNGNSTRHDMVRLNPDGSIDSSFSLPNEMANNGQYYDIVQLSTGEFLVVGSFTGVGGCSYAMKLNSTGSSATCLGNPNTVALKGLETSNGIYVAGTFTALGSTVRKYLYEYGKYSTAYVDGDTGKLTGTGNILSGGTIDFNHANSNVFMDSTGLFTGDAYSSTIGMIDFDYEPVRILDLTGPSGSITINSGDINTTTRDIVINMTSNDAVSGVKNMIICEDNTFAGCTWENYSSSKQVTLSEAEGTKNIYMKLVDHAGNESVIFTDSIFLDSLPPSLPTELTVSPDEYSSTDEFDLSWTASVDSGIGDVIYEYKTGTNSGVYSTWQTTTETTLENIPSYLSGENTFYLRAKDSLENTSEQVEVKYYYDGESPTAPTNIVVTSPALSTVNSFSFSWGASSDIGVGQVTYQYRLANTQTWTTVVGTSVSNIKAYMTGNNIFYVRSVDSVGNVSQEASVTFTFNPIVEQEDITPPVVENTTPDPTPTEEETGTGDVVVEEPVVETPVVQEPVVQPETTTETPRIVTQEETVVIDGETVSVGDLFSESEEFIELPEGVDPITVEDGIEIGATITGDDETVQVNTVVKGNTIYVKDIEELTISIPVSSVASKTADTDIKGVAVEFGEITAQAVMNENKTHYVADIEFGEIKSTNTVLAKVVTDYENGERLIKGMNFVLQAKALQTVAVDIDWAYAGIGFLLIIVLGYVTYKADKKTYLKESI